MAYYMIKHIMLICVCFTVFYVSEVNEYNIASVQIIRTYILYALFSFGLVMFSEHQDVSYVSSYILRLRSCVGRREVNKGE